MLRTFQILDKQNNQEYDVTIKEVFPYESSRKRMSVIVRLPPALLAACGGGCAVRLYCKGADNVLLDALAAGSRGTDEDSMAALNLTLQVGLHRMEGSTPQPIRPP